MRIGFACILGASIFAAAPAFAQSPLNLPELDRLPSPVAPKDSGTTPTGTITGAQPTTTVVTTDGPRTEITFDEPRVEPFTFWARAEYLLFFVKNTPMPVSLVTGPDPTNPTQELLNSDRSFGPFSGMRFTVGAYLDAGQSRGFEANYFALQRRSTTFSAGSDDAGTPTLQFPFVNLSPGAVGNFLMPIAYPGIFAGGVSVTSTLNLWGSEINGLQVFVPRQAGFELVGLLGVRYLNLQENLDISSVSSALLTSPNTVLAQSDQFNARNQFYGGQLGARVGFNRNRLHLNATGKIALGVNHEVVNIFGT
ncbi:MAG TPA: BBP7 family outer membrane beta-barrel protein, partial [Gemmataceae bacterium]|nr:BBP7 family outer membrane beta-barrel protein [Gemmataceae bacterium]